MSDSFTLELAVEILLWKTLATVKDRLDRLMVPSRKARSNRRVSKKDRRRSVNEGVVVTLSTREEKRKNPDRRNHATVEPHFQVRG